MTTLTSLLISDRRAAGRAGTAVVRGRGRGSLALVLAVSLVILLMLTAGASAARAASPAWRILGVTGPTNLPPVANEVQKVAVDAGGGTFTLSFKGQTTSPIDFDATPTQVKSALDALSTIGGTGGSVGVSGGPGDTGATKPYVVTFGGSLAGLDVPELTVSPGSLLDAVGQALDCSGGPVDAALDYQWLRNGNAITGATGSSYQTTASDAGAAIQCQVAALSSNSGSVQTSVPVMVAPVSGQVPPTPPSLGIAAPTSSGFFGLTLNPGDTLTCNPGAAGWGGSPSSFGYRWFDNGKEIVGATGDTYLTQDADFPGAFQCEVTATNSGGSSAAASAIKNSTSAPSPAAPVAAADLPAPNATTATTTTGGSTGTIAIYATNIGGVDTTGTVTVSATLPVGITTGGAPTGRGWTCTPAASGAGTFTCTTTQLVQPGSTASAIQAPVIVGPAASGTVNAKLSISGGGASTQASYDEPIKISATPAKPGIQAFWAGTLDADGQPETQAGAHPYTASTAFLVNTVLSPSGKVVPAGDARDIRVDLPSGFAGNPLATTRCPRSGEVDCTSDAIVGQASAVISFAANLSGNAVYSDTPPAGYPAEFSFNMVSINISVVASLRSDGDYGLTVTAPNVPQSPYKVYGSFLTFWGVPGDPTHDAERCGHFSQGQLCTPKPSTTPVKAFLTNPTDCAWEAVKPPVTDLLINTWQEPKLFGATSYTSPPVIGCNKLAFQPSLAFQPDTTQADAPMGASVDLDVPQPGLTDPAKLATPALKKTVVKLPAGVSINPAAANGLVACSTQQIGLIGTGFASPNRIRFNKAAPSCPDGSKIGTVRIDTPLLDHPLSGTVYLAAQDDNPFHSLFAMYLAVKDLKSGITIKLPGLVQADERTGQLTVTFDDNPQLPFTKLHLQLRGGSRAPLATPKACGSHATTTALASWSAPSVADVSSVSPFGIACRPGLGWFGPFFSAGTVSPVAGASSPFVLRIDKPDGQSDMNGISLTLPEGLLASLKGNVGRQIGTASVGAGPGPTPFWLSGPVVLEGPYGDAPFSLRVTVPVIAGPFNLGDVVVRQKIYVDPHDAHVTVVSDPLPTIVKGVPVRLQNLRVNVDKAGFMRNPTSCAVKSIGGTLGADTGQTAAVASRFQVGACANLPLNPKMTMELKGSKQIKRGKHPEFSTTLTQQPGESNLKSVKVRLPLSLALDPDNAEALCKPEQAAAKACPKASIVGKAVAISPVLNQPLRGDVFFVEGTRQSKQGRTVKTLPKLWVALRGEVAIDVWADSSISQGKYLVTTFPFVPDAPISSFKLDINGGDHGILAVTGDVGANLCQRRLITNASYVGQNGKQVQSKVHMDSPCGFKVRAKSVSISHAKVTVSGISAGKLTISGKGIHKTSRTIKHSKVATLKPRLTATGKKLYKGRKAIRLKVTFNPKAKGEKAKHTKTTVKRAKKASSSTRSHRASRKR